MQMQCSSNREIYSKYNDMIYKYQYTILIQCNAIWYCFNSDIWYIWNDIDWREI